ncbi:MAG: lysylphosphatidylglycerol synthase transmembrane domain-containing protein [Candidatus Omnitrophota bacterium]|nr:lysylphosphatidylglycerol synthase transmembrane domain-containing protein [Candidatus Omnitrophota bacterium]
MKRAIMILLSVGIMAIIFWRIDVQELKRYIVEVDVHWLVLAVMLFIPQIYVSAYRWQMMVADRISVSLWECTKLALAAASLNILVPSRVGDLSKPYFMGKIKGWNMHRGLNVVVFEKYIDLASLAIVILTGTVWSLQADSTTLFGVSFSLAVLAVFPVIYFIRLDRWAALPFWGRHKILRKMGEFLLESQMYLNDIKTNHGRVTQIIGVSVGLWFLHIIQFYVFFLAFHSQVSVFDVFRLVPIAILVGLLPLTVAGVGTRDSAMIYLFKPLEEVSLIVGVGLFVSLRYFVPGLLGLPFLNQYVVKSGMPKDGG